MLEALKTLWLGLRRVSGDDAYERYLEHRARCQASDPDHAPGKTLSRAEYFKERLERKWDGVKRCC
ncbi:MAG: CstA-like transporter-associated (seleno)protein [Blastocatellia bacterium]